MTRPQLIIGFITVGVWLVSIVVRVVRPATVGEFAPLDGVAVMVFGALFAHGALGPRARKDEGSS